MTCKITVSYGDWSADLFSLGAPGSPFEEQRPGVPPRDEIAEFRVMDTAALYFDFYKGGLAFEERDDARLFCLLTEGLSALSELGEVMLSDRLRQISVRPAPKLSVRATVKSNLLDVELGASGLSASDLAIYLDSYKRHQTFARLTSGDIIRLDEGARAAFGLAEDLGVDAVDLLDGVSLPASSTLFVDSMLARTPALEADRDAAFRRTVERLDALGKMDFTVPVSLKATLRGYQVDGYQWLGSLEHLGLGGILADDMGLGKTLQMIAHILARVEAGDTKPTLVVCPASLVYNWTAELERFAPSLDVCAIVGAKAQRRVQIAGADEHNVVVTSYDLMRRDIDEYAERDFARVVLDEAQYIKNPLTQVARAAKRLPAGVRFALTGTPIENRLSELWSIFDFLMPGLLGTRESFVKRFESPVEHAKGDSAARLQALVSPFVLRRVKEDVVADLRIRSWRSSPASSASSTWPTRTASPNRCSTASHPSLRKTSSRCSPSSPSCARSAATRVYTTRITRRGAPNSIRAWSSCTAHSTADIASCCSASLRVCSILSVSAWPRRTSPSLSSRALRLRRAAPRWSRSSKRARFRSF